MVAAILKIRRSSICNHSPIIQLETKDITTRLRGINHINLLYYYPKPRSDVLFQAEF